MHSRAGPMEASPMRAWFSTRRAICMALRRPAAHSVLARFSNSVLPRGAGRFIYSIPSRGAPTAANPSGASSSTMPGTSTGRHLRAVTRLASAARSSNCPRLKAAGRSVFLLTNSGNGWTKSMQWNFTGNNGRQPWGAMSVGDFGTTYAGGGTRNGNVFELRGGGLIHVIHVFGDASKAGHNPLAGVTKNGRNLYG